MMGAFGGVAEVIRLYAHATKFFDPAQFRFTFLCDRRFDTEWLRQAIPSHAQIVLVSDDDFQSREVTAIIWRNTLTERLFNLTAPAGSLQMRVQDATALWLKHGVNIVHLPYQFAIDSDLPTIYHPHDLQHIHLPEYFRDEVLMQRELLYQYFCHKATVVACTSRWIAQDIATQYQINPDKISVIPWATTTKEVSPLNISQIKSVLSRHNLVPDGYMILPAQTWPHKNHLGAIRALDIVRQKYGLRPVLICTGSINEQAQHLFEEVARLNLTDQVRFLGYVDREELTTLYQCARFTLIPTKFEAASAPLWDAFTLGCPVACATTTSLPSQSRGGAFLFDPNDIGQIAEAIKVMWIDADLRQRLVSLGSEAVKPYNWEMTARGFAILYKQVLGLALSVEERAALAALPIF